jgi:phage gp46-like protein
MSDISTVWTGTHGDWQLSQPSLDDYSWNENATWDENFGGYSADVQSGGDLETAILVSLFTDRLANEDDKIPDGTNDPRGWVGDLDQTVSIGSRLWILDRSKLTNATAITAKGMAADALQWLIDDGVVAKFDIKTEVIFPNRLNMQVVAFRQDGSRVALDFTHVWKGLN